MNEELQKVVESGKISPDVAEKLDQLQPGAYCQHKSWGFGKVAEWNLLTGQIFIDFGSRKSHPMQLEYASTTLSLIPAGHVRARLASDLEAVLAEAKEQPGELAKSVIRDFGGRATAEQITSTFVPHGMDAATFKKFWDAAKKQLKKDPLVHLPAKKTEPFELHDEPINQSAKLISSFREARHPKQQVIAVDAIVKALDDLVNEVEELKVLAAEVEEVAGKGQRLHAAPALELLLARDEICAKHEALQPGEGAASASDILRAEQTRLADLFAAIPAAKHRRLLTHFPEAFGDAWQSRALSLALKASPRLVQEIARLFEVQGAAAEFGEAFDKWIRERSLSPEALQWFCKERGGAYPELFTPDIFSAILTSLEQDMLSDVTRGTKLHDLVMDDKELLEALLGPASLDEVKDAVRKLKLTTVFDDLDKRSLLARFIKMQPEIQAMVTGEQEDGRDESLVVSWSSLEKRRLEYEDLVNRQIPQNTKDISIARSYGDLRENFEFKSAKEQQRVLLRRKSEMEQELGAARGTNFEDVETDKVSIGCVVELVDLDTGGTETYSILGAWDSFPEKGIVSYQAAIGQALLGKAVGEALELPTETLNRKMRVEKISAFKDLDLLKVAAQPATAE